MGRRLVSRVHVIDEEFRDVAFDPGDDVPEWAAAQMGDHCWVSDGVDYDGLTVPQLKKEIADRNADRGEESRIVAAGTKAADLIGALLADDAADG